MSERKQFRAIKGTRDILPPDSALWNRVEQTARDVFMNYGFGEIRLPIFEETELFARSIGVETDVVGKEMYTFEDRPAKEFLDLRRPVVRHNVAFKNGDVQSARVFLHDLDVFLTEYDDARKADAIPDAPENQKLLELIQRLREKARLHLSNEQVMPSTEAFAELLATLAYRVEDLILGELVSLRPEATASVCRAYIQHGMHTWRQPVKLYYIGPMFRRERPQKGRYRQFYQIGAEVLGQSDAPAIDAELIEMLLVFFRRAGLDQTKLYINSIGDKNCRPQYVELLRNELRKVKDQLREDSQRRIETNPLRVLDSKVPEEQPIIEKLPRIADHLCDACREHFAKLKEELNLRDVKYEENWRLVRGLDYYTRTTFEVTAAGLGSQNAVCGGGRYDGLIELLGGPPTKGIGFSVGTDRLVLALGKPEGSASFVQDLAVEMTTPDVVIAGTSSGTWDRAAILARDFRERGLSVYLPRSGTKLPKVFEVANKMGIRAAILVGEDELKQNNYAVRILRPVLLETPRDLSIAATEIIKYGKLVKLRQDLDRALARLSGQDSIPSGVTLSRVAKRLTTEGIIPERLTQNLADLMSVLNSAIHGRELADGSTDWALAFGSLLRNELETITSTER